MTIGAVFIGSLFALSVWLAAGLAQEPSSRTAGMRQAEGLLIARCAVCHSTDLVVQQRLGRLAWEAAVAKMRHWGAELSDEEAGLLVDYLAGRYHATAPDHLPEDRHEATPFRFDEDSQVVAEYPPGNAKRGAGLFTINCQACHGAKAVGGAGPKLAGNPILGEDERFWETVVHGRGAMPAWGSNLKPQEIADIQAWLRALD
jgi:cytochrome c oxidase cbb3-type subunit 3